MVNENNKDINVRYSIAYITKKELIDSFEGRDNEEEMKLKILSFDENKMNWIANKLSESINEDDSYNSFMMNLVEDC